MPLLTNDLIQRSVKDARVIESKGAGAQALVVGSGLIVAPKNVPTKIRQDIVNCMLFAQLAASGAVADPSKGNEWHAEYFRALSACGWGQSGTHFEEYRSSGKHLETHKSIIKVLTEVVGPTTRAAALVTEMLNALQSMDENSPWITLFNRESTFARTSRFQVVIAQRNGDDLVEIALGAFELKSKANFTQVLFCKFASNKVSLKVSRGKATIHEADLAQKRKQLKERLEPYQSEYIREVKFPPKPDVVRSGGAVRTRLPATRIESR